MRTANIINLTKLNNLPDQDGDQPVYLVKTDWNGDSQNSFYMDQIDSDGHTVTIPTTSAGNPRSTVSQLGR